MNIIQDYPNTLPEHILKVLERYWGYSLPQEYREFLLKHNGGEPQQDCFDFKNGTEGSNVRSFLGIYPDKHSDLLNHIKIYENRIPTNMFPIAYDSLGNLILIAVKNSDRGKVYFWDHEMEADPAQGEVPDYSNLTLIADSFQEFIDSLFEYKEASNIIYSLIQKTAH